MPMNSKTTGTAAMQALSQNYQFNLSDFALFLSVMKNKTAYENTLSIILDEPDLKLAEVEVEQVVLNKSGKSAIRLDAWARDVSDRRFNTEMQNDTEADDVRRRDVYKRQPRLHPEGSSGAGRISSRPWLHAGAGAGFLSYTLHGIHGYVLYGNRSQGRKARICVQKSS